MFIRTIRDERIPHSLIVDSHVAPEDNGKWALYVKLKDETTIYVAAFDSVAEANNANDSMKEAKFLKKGWDAKEYQKGLRPLKKTS